MKNESPHPNILIAGLAKTGTTILFTRIRASLPVPPATFFEPSTPETLEHILQTGHTTPTLTKCLIGQVSGDTPGIARFTHPILIIRDPRDQFVSEMLYDFYKFDENRDASGYAAARRCLKTKIRRPDSISCAALFQEIRHLATQKSFKVNPVQLLASKYHRLEHYRETINPFLVRYEDIVDDRLAPLAHYLDLNTIRTAEVDDALRRVRRTRAYGEWKQWFTPEDLREFEIQLGPFMTRYGYTPSPLPPSRRIPLETSLHYIRQFRPRPAPLRERLRRRTGAGTP